MGEKEISLMKPGSLLINASRGTVVDIPALCDALASKHLAGAAIDVFPTEPFMILKTNCRWATPLRYSIFLTC